RWASDGTVDARMISHGLRSLVKQGHPGALAVLGFSTDAKVDVAAFAVAPESVRLGDHIELEAVLKSTAKQEQRLVVDFIIHHPTSRGAISTKVFKWATVQLEAGGERTLTKRRRIDTASTRRYTAGVHTIELQVAGSVLATTSFGLLDSSP
ncbi:MAG: DNA alkylation repair protein, partial [Acidimicrobiia bacterium]|nr:DNA alkylation repair protein [Acidimicrobiia bacterium]